MKTFDFDLFTIGGGSGGVRASRIAAQYGARVALAEHQFLGGTCVNVGCIPKKLLTYAAAYRDAIKQAPKFGWEFGKVSFDWKRLVSNVSTEISRLNSVYQNLLANSGVTLVDGHAQVEDAHTVSVNGQRYTAKHILIATGGRPIRPKIPGAELGIVSDQFFQLNELPDKAVVVGGGYIAVELASILNGLGVGVTLVHRGPRLLREMDADLGEFLIEEIRKKGVEVKLNCEVTEIESLSADLKKVSLTDGDVIQAGLALFCIGRKPLVEGMRLERTGVTLTDSGAIQVNDAFQTTVPSIYAVGDVIDRIQLTPVALEEGMALATNLFGQDKKSVSYTHVPTAVFSFPNVGTVGLSEQAARRVYKRLKIYKSNFKALKSTVGDSSERVFMKLIVESESDRVVGVHMVGPEAGEIIQGFAVAMQGCATKAQFDSTIAIHPTIAEEFVTMRTPVEEVGLLTEKKAA